MKNLFLLLILSVSTLLSSCQDDDTLSPQEAISGYDKSELNQTIYADETSTNNDFKFIASDSWYTSISCVSKSNSVDWLTLNPSSGDAGSMSVSLELETNLTGADRTAQVDFICNQNIVSLTITQKSTTASGETEGEVDLTIEKEALIQLYDETNGDNWTNNENWNSDEPIEEWFGVTINESTKGVESLSLQNNNLIGIANVSNFQLLKSVDFSNNNLSGINILNQTHLSSVNIQGNNISMVLHSNNIPSDFICDEWGDQDYDLYPEPNYENGYQYPQYVETEEASDVWDGSTSTPQYIDETNKIIHISTPSELAWLAEETDKSNSSYKQFKDWTIYQKSSFNLDLLPWKPIGVDEDFAGVYDGENHMISGLRIISSEYKYAGLFGSVWGAVIKNTNVFGIISNMKDGGYAGGICGYAREVRINDCINTAIVSGDLAAGILGSGIGGEIYSCTNVGIISANETSAGIVGLMKYSAFTIEYCANTSYVSSYSSTSDATCGGIIGAAVSTTGDVTIMMCTNLCEVGVRSKGDAVAGGIIGKTNGDVDLISHCFNIGNVYADSDESYAYSGAISGTGFADVTSCVNEAPLITAISSAEKTGSATAGGISSKNYGSIQGCVNAGSTVSAYSQCGYTDSEGTYMSKSYVGEINGTSDTSGSNASYATLIGSYKYFEK